MDGSIQANCWEHVQHIEHLLSRWIEYADIDDLDKLSFPLLKSTKELLISDTVTLGQKNKGIFDLSVLIKSCSYLKSVHILGILQFSSFIRSCSFEGYEVISINSSKKYGSIDIPSSSVKRRWSSLINKIFSPSNTGFNAASFSASDTNQVLEDELMAIRNQLAFSLESFLKNTVDGAKNKNLNDPKLLASKFAQAQLTCAAVMWDKLLERLSVTTPLSFNDCNCFTCSNIDKPLSKPPATSDAPKQMDRRISSNVIFKIRDSPRHLSRRFEYVSQVIGASPPSIDDFSNISHSSSNPRILFKHMLQFYIALEACCLPVPVGFHPAFIAYGYHSLNPWVLMQYIDRGILKPSESFLKTVIMDEKTSLTQQIYDRTHDLSKSQKYTFHRRADMVLKDKLYGFLDKKMDESTIGVDRYPSNSTSADLFETAHSSIRELQIDSDFSVDRSSPISVPSVKKHQSREVFFSLPTALGSSTKSSSSVFMVDDHYDKVVEEGERVDGLFDFLPLNVFHNYLIEKECPERDLEMLQSLSKVY